MQYIDIQNVIRGTIWGAFLEAATLAAHYCTYIC